MRRLFIMTSLGALALLTTGCARRDPIQTDRTAFTFDSTYQRNTYSQPIEATFDRTVTVFREAGYTLDLVAVKQAIKAPNQPLTCAFTPSFFRAPAMAANLR